MEAETCCESSDDALRRDPRGASDGESPSGGLFAFSRFSTSITSLTLLLRVLPLLLGVGGVRPPGVGGIDAGVDTGIAVRTSPESCRGSEAGGPGGNCFPGDPLSSRCCPCIMLRRASIISSCFAASLCCKRSAAFISPSRRGRSSWRRGSWRSSCSASNL